MSPRRRLSAALLAVALTSCAGQCFGQVWIMRKPKQMIDEQKRQEEEAQPKAKPATRREQARQRPAEPQLILSSKRWRVTLSRWRIEPAPSAHSLVEAKIERRADGVSPWFLPQWIALWDQAPGASADGAPRVTLPLRVLDNRGKLLAGPLKVEEVRRVTLVFPEDGAERIRLLDLALSPLTHIRMAD